jgi:hypothetical protein
VVMDAPMKSEGVFWREPLIAGGTELVGIDNAWCLSHVCRVEAAGHSLRIQLRAIQLPAARLATAPAPRGM